MTKPHIVGEKTLFGVLKRRYKVCFSLAMILPISFQWLFLSSTCLDSEPLHFALESVEFFHASLYRWCLKNKLIWACLVIFGKGYWEITDVVTFFLIANCSTIVPEIFKMYNL